MNKISEYIKSKPLLVSFLCGMAFALTFMSPYLFLLTWVFAAPFLIALFGIEKKKILFSFLCALLFALGFYTVLYTWFLSLHPLTYMGFETDQSMGIVILIWISISVAQALQMSLAGLVFSLTNPKGFFKPFAFALLWSMVEWIQGFGDFAMTWGKLALSQYWFTPNIQIISLFGSLALAFLIMAVNGLVALCFMCDNKKRAAYLALSLFIANMFFGTAALAIKNVGSGNTQFIRIAAVQCNFPSDKKWYIDNSVIYDELKNNSDKAVSNGAKIIIWPESSLTEDLMPDGTFYRQISDYARDNNVYMVVGGFTNDPDAETYVLYNSVVVFAPDGADHPVYIKQKLVPFAEYMPLKDLTKIFKFMEKLNLRQEITPGEETVVFDLDGARLSPLVCFDSIFPQYSTAAANDGAQILAICTNDSWFLGSEAVTQHKGHAVLRAVENNRYMLRSTNSGESAIISNNGTVLRSLSAGTDGYVIEDIPLINEKTPYTVWGDWPFLIIAVLTVLIYVEIRGLSRNPLNRKLPSSEEKKR